MHSRFPHCHSCIPTLAPNAGSNECSGDHRFQRKIGLPTPISTWPRLLAAACIVVTVCAGTNSLRSSLAAPVEPNGRDESNGPAIENAVPGAVDPDRPAAPSPAVTASYEQGLLPFLKQYCVDCHGDGAHKGDFRFDQYRDVDMLKRDRPVWTKALKLLKVGAMPPPEADTPPAAERAQAVN